MATTIIGVDPHKRTHTAVVLDESERIVSELRIEVDRRQTNRLLAWANPWPDRMWAVENAYGLGRMLAQELVRRGEHVVDVPATLSARARKLSGMSGRKTDPHDARSVAIAAAHNRGLRAVELEDPSVALGLLVRHREQLVDRRTQIRCRVQALLAELVPAGAPPLASLRKASKLLATVRPASAVDAERKQITRELLEEWRWLNRRITAATRRVDQAVQSYGTTLTRIHGVGNLLAATIIAIVGDIRRFPTEGHFAAYNGTAPIEASSGDIRRHRLSRRGNRKLNSAIHIIAVVQLARPTNGRVYYERKIAEGKSRMEALRALKRHISNTIYRHLVADARAHEAARGGQSGTSIDLAV